MWNIFRKNQPKPPEEPTPVFELHCSPDIPFKTRVEITSLIQQKLGSLQILDSTEYESVPTHEAYPWDSYGSDESQELAETPYTPNVTRGEVHEAIMELLHDPANQQRVASDLERRFPVDTWEDTFPYVHAMQALLDGINRESQSGTRK